MEEQIDGLNTTNTRPRQRRRRIEAAKETAKQATERIWSNKKARKEKERKDLDQPPTPTLSAGSWGTSSTRIHLRSERRTESDANKIFESPALIYIEAEESSTTHSVIRRTSSLIRFPRPWSRSTPTSEGPATRFGVICETIQINDPTVERLVERIAAERGRKEKRKNVPTEKKVRKLKQCKDCLVQYSLGLPWEKHFQSKRHI